MEEKKKREVEKLTYYRYWTTDVYDPKRRASQDSYLTKEECEHEGEKAKAFYEDTFTSLTVEGEEGAAPSVYQVAKNVFLVLLREALLESLHNDPQTLAAVKKVEAERGPKAWLMPVCDGERSWIEDSYDFAMSKLSRETVRGHVFYTLNKLGLKTTEANQAADMAMAFTGRFEAREVICREPHLYRMVKSYLDFFGEQMKNHSDVEMETDSDHSCE